jgi:transposase
MVLKTFTPQGGVLNTVESSKEAHEKINGIPRQHFNLFLKECEWRFNTGTLSKLLVDLKSLLKEGY